MKSINLKLTDEAHKTIKVFAAENDIRFEQALNLIIKNYSNLSKNRG